VLVFNGIYNPKRKLFLIKGYVNETIEEQHIRSILKLLQSIFYNLKSANFFYVNDLNVVIDVVILATLNLPPEDQVSSSKQNHLLKVFSPEMIYSVTRRISKSFALVANELHGLFDQFA
jgi:hypothetical protein